MSSLAYSISEPQMEYMKTTQTSRYLLGIIYLSASIAGMLGKVSTPEPTEAQAFMGSLASSGLIYLVKILELIGALGLLSGLYVPIALVILAPITRIIFWFHLNLDLAGAPIGICLTILWMWTATEYKQPFLQFLNTKPNNKGIL